MSLQSDARPLTDSPWFWAYLFGTAALLALAIAAPKFGPRQAQIEREYQGRTRAAQNLNGAKPDLELSTAERTLVTLRPLFLTLAAITTGAWIVVWWTRSRRVRRLSATRTPPPPDSPSDQTLLFKQGQP